MRLALRVLAALLLGAVLPARAQLLGGLPRLPVVPDLTRALPTLPAAPAPLVEVPLRLVQDLRRRTIDTLLREHADVLEPDTSGEPVVRGELLLSDPPRADLDAALAAGFHVLREQVLDSLDEHLVVLAPPGDMSLQDAAQRLHSIDPAMVLDLNPVYTRSGTLTMNAADNAATDSASPTPTPTPTPTPRTGPGIAPSAARVGLVDGGIDRAHPSLVHASLRTWGCGGHDVPDAHGTAVASLLVGRDGPFSGSAAGSATLYAADIYCGEPTGGSSDKLAQALAWLAGERVPVINLSLVGPPNRVLERAVKALIARGHIVVAAVGNDGPAAPPLYPASYPDVVGVTGVLEAAAPAGAAVRDSIRVLPEAAQGPQVSFAAPGAALPVAQAGGSRYALARGTSFAAPIVAGRLSRLLPSRPDPAAARDAIEALRRQCVDLGTPGRDDVYGWGLVDWPARAMAARVDARRPLQRQGPAARVRNGL